MTSLSLDFEFAVHRAVKLGCDTGNGPTDTVKMFAGEGEIM